MKADAARWLAYASENAAAAALTLEAGLLNPSLQNSQQAVEKALKAMRVQRDMGVRRTHSIRDLCRDLLVVGVATGLSEEDCELLDSIYVGSKYPGDSAFAEFPPNVAVTSQCLELARRVLAVARHILDEP